MREIPKLIDGAKVVLYTPLDGRHTQTGNCKHIVAGVWMGTTAGLAICRYEGEHGFYLFRCDEKWNTQTDTWHETVVDAKAQAEFEYDGVCATWQELEG